jgi:hypothetical protein
MEKKKKISKNSLIATSALLLNVEFLRASGGVSSWVSRFTDAARARVCACSFPCYMPQIFHPSWFNHPNDI